MVGGDSSSTSPPAANPHLLREEGECAAFSVQTDREGRPKGVIILDPQEMIIQSGER
jgi:hypothetical protein